MSGSRPCVALREREPRSKHWLVEFVRPLRPPYACLEGCQHVTCKRGVQERRAEADWLFRTNTCCLDPGLGKKIRERFASADELLADEEAMKFFRMLFTRVVISTALVECSFAAFRRWLIKCGSAVGIQNLACRHTLQAFVRAMEHLNPGMRIGRPVLGTKKKRPPWILKARTRAGYGRGVSGRDVFFSKYISEQGGTFAEAMQAWRKADPSVRSDCNRRASGKRAVFNELMDPLKCANEQLNKAEDDSSVQSPWGLGGPLYPLKQSHLEDALAQNCFVRDASYQWSERFGIKQQHDPAFPDKVGQPEFCLNRLSRCSTLFGAGIHDLASELRRDLQVIISPRRAPLNPAQYIVVQFNDMQQVLLILSYLKQPFSCELIPFRAHDRDRDLLNTVIDLAPLVYEKSGFKLLPVETEMQWSSRLAQQLNEGGALGWRRLIVDPVLPAVGDDAIHLSKVLVRRIENIDLEAERESQMQADVVAKALKALQRSQQPWQQRSSVKRVAKDRPPADVDGTDVQ